MTEAQVEVRKRGDEAGGRRSIACLLLGIALLPLELLLGLACRTGSASRRERLRHRNVQVAVGRKGAKQVR